MPLLFIAIPLLAVMLLNMLYKWASRKTIFFVALAVALVQIGIAAADVFACLNRSGSVTSTYLAPFSVDLLSAVVLFSIGLIAVVTIIVANVMIKRDLLNFISVLLLLIIGMNGITMVADLFSLYVFIEATAAASFILIAIDKKKDALEGAFKYYLMSAIATVMMLLSIALLFMLVGATDFASVAGYIAGLQGHYPPALICAFILYTVALAIKSGAVPFHTWVPDAHSSAPSPVSVILAGAVIKVSGVYVFIRVYRDVFLTNSSMGHALMLLGLLSIVVGALGAMGQSDIKRMLAFSSVSQIGYIVLGIGTGSAIGFAGAVFHFFNHATFKSLLFVDAAAVAEETGTRDMDKMGGLSERMPITGTSSVIGLLSMAGIPPLSGFWSKLLIIIALWRVSGVLAIAALAASILTLGYFLLLQKKVFFGKLGPEMQHVKECSRSIVGLEVLLSAVNIAMGLLFPCILLYMQARGLL